MSEAGHPGMRVLVVDEEIPYPLDSGKRLRTFNLLCQLARRHQIVFLCRRHAGVASPSPAPLEGAGIRVVQVDDPIRQKSGWKFYGALLANLVSPNPYVVASHYSPALVAAIRAEAARAKPDLFHCEWAPYAENLKPFLPAPSVVVAHNVEALIWERLAAVERNPARRAYIWLQWKKMERFERDAVTRFTRVVAVSKPDRRILAQWVPERRIAVVDNGVDLDFFCPADAPTAARSVVFTGSLDWHANIDCVRHLLDDIWPRVLQRFPDATATIVGRRPPPQLVERAQAEPSVTLAASVPDVRPYVHESAIYVVPLRVGGGSRLKILEALAMGKAVVSTSIGAEGLEVTDGEDILLADTPHAFAEALAGLFADPTRRQRLGAAGRRLVTERYGWEGLARRLESVWTEASAAWSG